MVVKVTVTCIQFSQPSVPQSPSSPRVVASRLSSPSRKDEIVLRRHRSAIFETTSSRLRRTRSYEHPKQTSHVIRRACSASLDAFSDEEFSKRIEELALKFHHSNDENEKSTKNFTEIGTTDMNMNSVAAMDESMAFGIQRKANRMDLPLSLRMIKRKKQWQEGFIEASESMYCSIKKAFSSMVFIIEELHSYTLKMREILLYEDLQGIIVRVQKEIQASFVWLFQRVFSHTPTLMVYVMILLANFTVHSMSCNAAVTAVPPPESQITTTTTINDNYKEWTTKFDFSVVKGGKTTAIGGSNGGGGKTKPMASAMDGGDGRFHRSENHHRTILPDGVSQPSPLTTREEASTSGQEEVPLWNAMVEEASRMQGCEEGVNAQRLVAPVTVRADADEYTEYVTTELQYQMGLAHEPNNALLLANYAQFLYLVAHDYDRAEEYFKRATGVEPKDAEAYNKYANFLWQVKNDLWAAEETYLEAISADPTNSYYAANYAHFLWNTGGDDTCFPLSPP